jgi:hypothetical protein
MKDNIRTLPLRCPRFDHGEDLEIVVKSESVVFRSDAPNEYLESDNAVYVKDKL